MPPQFDRTPERRRKQHPTTNSNNKWQRHPARERMSSRSMERTPLLLLVSLLLGSTVSLDVRVVNTTCDVTLPLTASIYLQCNGDGRCTFGEVSTIYGNFAYNGVENSGIQNNYGYLSADLSLFGMDFNLCTMQQVPLCDDTMTADEYNENDCPGDGTFAYSIQYQLPSSGPEAASWLATGWRGTGVVKMYAEPNESMQIGQCHLNLQTFVTQKDSNSLLGTPSAAVSTGILLAGIAFMTLFCCYCYCCRRRRKVITTSAATVGVSKMDDDSAYFKRLEEDKSYWSGSKKSGKSGSARSKKTEVSEHASVVSDL